MKGGSGDNYRTFLLRVEKVLAAFFRGRGCDFRTMSRGNPLIELEQTGHIAFLGAPEGAPAPGRRQPEGTVAVVFVAGNSQFTTGAGLESLASMLEPAAETVFLLPADVVEKSHITKKVADLNSRGAGRFSAHPYSHFVIEVPLHCEVPAYEIVPPAAAERLLRMERLAPGDLPLVRASDAPLVWAGARAGDVVKQTSNSPTAVESVRYLRVV